MDSSNCNSVENYKRDNLNWGLSFFLCTVLNLPHKVIDGPVNVEMLNVFLFSILPDIY